MLTVSNFLQLEPFKNFNVVSGFRGLSNKISSINIMDNPDALDWFSPEEMLLSSGYFFKDNEIMQDKILKQLKTISCPALIIKPRSYLGKIPEKMISLSNELDIPIIEMPYGISFSKVMVRVMEELSEDYDALNKKSLDIHNEFFQITLHGGGLQKISDTLSNMLEASVFLCDQNWNILKSTETSSYAKVLYTDNSDKIFLSQPFLESLPPDFEDIQKPIVRSFEINNAKVPCVVMPVFFNNVHYGLIVVLQFTQSLKDHHYIALENGCMTFALEKIHLAEIERTYNRIREDFFDELLAGKITSATSLKNLANLHGIDMNLYYTAFVFNIRFQHANPDSIIDNVHHEESVIKKVTSDINNSSIKNHLTLLIFNRKNQIILLIGTTSKDYLKDTKAIKIKIEHFINQIESLFSDCLLYCGIGNVSKQLLDIKTSFYEAQEALRLTQSKPNSKKVYHYNDFSISHFLKKNIDYEELEAFFSSTLGSLYDYDQKHQSDLLETLECWVSNQLNIAETARQLYIHRNSLLYRIEKIKKILALDLKDSDDLLKIQLAIKIFHMQYQSNHL